MKPVLRFVVFVLLSGLFFFISCKKEYSCESCADKNKPPIASAGPDQLITLPIDSVLLDGSSSSDPDGTISSFQWAKISGPASFNIIKPTDSITKVKTLVRGTYQFELKITDNGGLSAKDTVQITVNDPSQPNRPPVANAGADQIITLPTNATNLDGSSSTDPDNNITSYGWTRISGPTSFNITNANNVQTQITNLIEGIYLFELKVTDAGGLFSKDTMQVTVDTAISTCPPFNRPVINAQKNLFGTLSEARSAISIASAGNKIVFAGGVYNDNATNNAVVTSTVDIYNMTTQTWSIAQLSIPRFNMTAITVGNKIYFAGGNAATASSTSSRIDIYDVISDTWSTAELSEERCLIAAAAVGNKILFAGGDSYAASNTVTNKVDIYDISSNTWSTATLSVARGIISATTVGNKVYFAGGDINVCSTSDRIDIYDNTTNTWSVSALSEPKLGVGGIAVGNKIYWAGGLVTPECFDPTIISCKVEIIDVVTGTTTISHLSQPTNHNKALLKNGSIIFYSAIDHFDIYNTSTDIWSIGVINQPFTLFYSAGVISVNNTIYIAGEYVNGVVSNKVWKLEF